MRKEIENIIKIDLPNIKLPISLTSGSSTVPGRNFVIITEKFSTKFGGRLPKSYLLELGACFLSVDGKNYSTIKDLSDGLMDFCEFSVEMQAKSFQTTLSQHSISHFIAFLKKSTAEMVEKDLCSTTLDTKELSA